MKTIREIAATAILASLCTSMAAAIPAPAISTVNDDADNRFGITTHASAVSFLSDEFVMNSKIVGSDTAKTAGFGFAIDISGDTAVVGANHDNIGNKQQQGSVYVYVKKSGVWVEQAKLIAADGNRKDQFGYRVAIDGNTIVVSAPLASTATQRYKGGVYVFTRTGDHWGEQVKLEPSKPTFAETFGSDIDISGDTIIVGAVGHDQKPEDNIAQAHGAAYIFKRTAGNWSERQMLSSGRLTSTGFGTSVGIHDDLAVIGTISDEEAVGAAYIFAYDGTSWKQDGKLRSGVRRGNEHFALQSVAIDRGTAVVGASGAGSRLPGAAYVFNKGTGGWSMTAKLTASDNDKENSFGQSVDISGDTIVAGMFQMGGPIAPRAYVYRRTLAPAGHRWTQSQMLISPETYLGDNFAYCVGISGENIIIGASNHDSDPRRRTRGAAYIFGSSAGSSSDDGQLRGSGQHIAIPLVKNARKDGYTIQTENAQYLFKANDVEDPVTKKLLEGLRELAYRCRESGETLRTPLTFSRGASTRVQVSCALLIEPQVLLIGDPGTE